MTFHEYRGPRRRHGAGHRRPSPTKQAPAIALVLKWREAWRAQMARKRKKEKVYELPRDGVFAAAMARAEFGRFYWNDRLARQLKSAMKRRPKEKR
jgi:hypothetical protein